MVYVTFCIHAGIQSFLRIVFFLVIKQSSSSFSETSAINFFILNYSNWVSIVLQKGNTDSSSSFF